jgi:hypothetical protein
MLYIGVLIKLDDGLIEVPEGPEMKDCHILDQALTQVDYLNQYGPCTVVMIGGKRHVIVMDPALFQEIATDNDLFGKPGTFSTLQ